MAAAQYQMDTFSPEVASSAGHQEVKSVQCENDDVMIQQHVPQQQLQNGSHTESSTHSSMHHAREKTANTISIDESEATDQTTISNPTESLQQQHSGKKEAKPKKKESPTVTKSAARLCGSCRSKCGYCCGERVNVLAHPDAYNKQIIFDSNDEDDIIDEEEGGDNNSDQLEEEEEEEDIETVDETCSSKSYGLIFDQIQYDTYEELINRGWRRSGKHLYRPHNFESCCPAVSIRLDVLRFAEGCQQNKNASREVGDEGKSDLAKAILIRGSKSQRKVGKNVLRALERYNDSCIGGSCSASKDHPIKPVPNHNDRVSPEAKHQHKKPRKQSPDRDQNRSAKSKKIDHQQTLLAGLQPFLNKLSGVVYRVITDEAQKIVASIPKDDASGNQNEKAAKWMWWQNDGVDDAADMSFPKWCSFKVSNSNSADTMVMVSTSACAAAAGRSRGNIDKSLLVQSVVNSLKEFMLSQQTDSNRDSPSVLVKDVSFHEKSGHVHVMLDLSQTTASNAGCKIPSVSKESGPPSAKSVGAVDPIAEFITRHEIDANKLSKPMEKLATQKRNTHQQRFLTVQSVPAHESTLQPEVHQLFCRYQTAVHGDVNPFCEHDDDEKEELNGYDTFRRKNDPIGFLDIDAAYSHLDEIQLSKIKRSYLTFYRFLGETPVKQDEMSSKNSQYDENGYDIHIPFGTYYQQYRLATPKDAFDGALIAVGVVDLLPHCFSSVYAFYDPILSSSLELGKYTALREIEWIRRACQFRPELHFYYLGYYIHSCPKMTYKADYKPSELLCPVNLKWVDFEVGKKRLEERSPVRHCCALLDNDSTTLECSDIAKQRAVDDVALDIGGFVKVGMLNQQGKDFVEPHVREFIDEVGIELSRHFVIKLR